MQQSMPDGLYDQILTDELASELSNNFQDSEYTVGPLDAASATRRLADSLADQLATVLQEIGSVSPGDTDPDSKVSRLQAQLEFANAMLTDLQIKLAAQYPQKDYGANIRLLAQPVQNLAAIHRTDNRPTPPGTGLRAPWLFTAAKTSPALLSELRHELASSDRINILMSFITVSGIRKIRDILQLITALDGRGQAKVKLRILTTTYIGATEAQAVDELARLPNCEVRISLDGRRTRLHAKA
jgi:hypothetical protein